MSTEWTPDNEVRGYIKDFDYRIRGREPIHVYQDVKFVLNDKFWKLGITLSKKKVLFHPRLLTYPYIKQAEWIVHELTHCAQWSDLGVIGFAATYTWEWIKSGFSYRKMKNVGLELEAYGNQATFRKLV